MKTEDLASERFFNFKYIPLHNSRRDKSKVKNQQLHLEETKMFHCFLPLIR